MALLFCDNFQQYGTGADPVPMTEGEVYALVSDCEIVDDPEPSITESVLHVKWSFGASGLIRKVLPATIVAGDPVGVGFRLWMDALPSSVGNLAYICVLRDGSNQDVVGIRVRTDGYLEALEGSNILDNGFAGGSTIIGASSGPCIFAGTWQQVEVKFVVDGAAGSVEVRVDGALKLNLTGVDTGTVDVTQLIHCNRNTGASSSSTFHMKDYFIWDDTGTYNNDFLGNCFVHSLIPDGDVSGTWTASGGGFSYADIDDASPDDNTTYISSAWPAATAEVVTLSDLPPDATRVLGMMSLVRAIKTDGGDASLVTSLVSTTNTVDGDTTPITTSYSYWTDIFEEDPDTSAAWTVAATNAVKLKINRTA